MRFPEQVGPGVYQIINTLTKVVYVGSTKNLRRRALAHFQMLQGRRHCNLHLQASWNKHGRKLFRFEILEECGPDDLVDREQYWLDKTDAYRKGYNRCPLAYRPTMSQESIAKMARTKTGRKLSPETKAKMSATRRGRKMSADHLAKYTAGHWSRGPNAAEIGARISASRLAKGLTCSLEHRAKISDTKKRQAAEKRAAALRETDQES